jgi:hypothetical protein
MLLRAGWLVGAAGVLVAVWVALLVGPSWLR